MIFERSADIEREADILVERINALLDAKSTTAKEKLTVFYNCLDVLDGKASTLLTFNGIVAAIYSYLMTQQFSETLLNMAKIFGELFIALGLICTLISVVCCLWVARISWRFFGHVATKPKINFDTELNHLAQAVERRTIRYQAAWLFSFVAMGFLAASLAIFGLF